MVIFLGFRRHVFSEAHDNISYFDIPTRRLAVREMPGTEFSANESSGGERHGGGMFPTEIPREPAEVVRVPEGTDGMVVRHNDPGYRPPVHRHAELEANLVLKGTASYLLGDRRYELGAGTLVWLFPGQDHVLVGQSPDYEMWWALFRPELVDRACASTENRPLQQTDPGGYFCKRLEPGWSARLDGLMREIEGFGPNGGFLGEDHQADLHGAGIAYLLLVCWQAYLESDEAVVGSDVHPAVERAARILRDEAQTGNVTELSRRVGLNPSRLGKLFREQTGVSIVEFRNRQRLERFLRLYGRGGRLTALEAALEAGFGSYAQFYRTFTAMTGKSPVAYRQELST